MTGGLVTETIDTGDRVWIACRGTGEDAYLTATLYVERTAMARSVSPGDRLRWQGATVFWTPRCTPQSGWVLTRVGPANPLRPTFATSATMYVGEDGG